MGKPSRDKGARGEREIVEFYRGLGFEVSRNPGQSDPAYEAIDVKTDVRGVDGIHIQVKRQETLHLPAWIKQAEDEAPDDSIPTVHFRRSHPAIPSEWWVALALKDFGPMATSWTDTLRRITGVGI